MDWKNYSGVVLIVLGVVSIITSIVSKSCIGQGCNQILGLMLAILGIASIIIGIFLAKSKEKKKSKKSK